MANQSFRLIVHQTINPGGLEEFSKLAQQGAANAEAGEPGTLGYEFFVNEEGSDCYLNEYYADSAAFLTHFARVQPILEASMKVSGLWRPSYWVTPARKRARCSLTWAPSSTAPA